MTTRYCFLALYRADKSASGLAFRMPVLWEELSRNRQAETYLIVNKTLYDKTLVNNGPHKNAFVIPEVFGFKFSCLFFAPFYLIFAYVKGCRKFHMSAGGAFFLKPLNRIKNLANITLHSSFGSRSIKMASNGRPKYERLHEDIFRTADSIDCLYTNNELSDDCAAKTKIAPCSFSWRYSKKEIDTILSNNYLKRHSILFVGSLTNQKNYTLALDGFELYLMETTRIISKTQINLSIAAPNVTEDAISRAERVNMLMGYEAIKFVDPRYIDDAYKSGFVFLSLQNYDNYPSQSLIESMIYGCTVIATDVGDTRRLVRPENNNILISSSAKDLSLAIERALRHSPSINRNNQLEVLHNHSVQRYSEYFAKNFILD